MLGLLGSAAHESTIRPLVKGFHLTVTVYIRHVGMYLRFCTIHD